MNRFALACVLALSTLCFTIRADAAAPPPLPKAVDSFESGSIRADVYGTPGKPVLIFIPGLTCGPWEWAGQIARFSPEYTIYALTLPGFDGRAAARTPLFATVSADFWTLLRTHAIAKPAIVGHSIGGTLAIMLAEQHPERLRAVVSVDGLPIFPGIQLLSAEQRAAMAKQASAGIAQMTPQAFAASQKRSLAYMVTAPEDVDAIAGAAANADPATTAQWMYEDLTLDLRPRLKNVTVPLTVIAPFDPSLDPYGPAKTSTADAKQQFYASLLENDASARVELIAPARHFVMYDQPGVLDTVLSEALARKSR